jgi:hypothetical protein
MPDPNDFAPIDARFVSLPKERTPAVPLHPRGLDDELGAWEPVFGTGELPDDTVCALEVDVERRSIKTFKRVDEFTGERVEINVLLRTGNGPLVFREDHLRSRWVFGREQGAVFPQDVQASFRDGFEEDEVPGMVICLCQSRGIIIDGMSLNSGRRQFELVRRKARRIRNSFIYNMPKEPVITEFKSEATYWSWALSMRILIENGMWPDAKDSWVCRNVRGALSLPTRREIGESRKCPIEWASPQLRALWAGDMRARRRAAEAGSISGTPDMYSDVNVHTEYTLGLEPWDIITPVETKL